MTTWLDIHVDDWDAVRDDPPAVAGDLDVRSLGDGLTALVVDLDDWR